MVAEESSIGGVKEGRQSEFSLQPPTSPSHLRSPLELESLALPQRRGLKKTYRWPRLLSSWFWEICSSTISIVSIVLMLVFLNFINKAPIENWVSQTSPSTIISITTIAARTTMMVPVASCIDQLKWQHYLHRPNMLHHFQIFEEASRGPWGAAKALLAIQTKASLILVLALVTIVNLAVEPMAQKILSTDICLASLHNASWIAVAQHYDSLSTDLDGQWLQPAYLHLVYFFAPHRTDIPNTGLGTVTEWALRVRATLLKALVGEVISLERSCWDSGTSCTWGNLTTLGVCQDTRNLTGQINPTKKTETLPTSVTNKLANQPRYT